MLPTRAFSVLACCIALLHTSHAQDLSSTLATPIEPGWQQPQAWHESTLIEAGRTEHDAMMHNLFGGAWGESMRPEALAEALMAQGDAMTREVLGEAAATAMQRYFVKSLESTSGQEHLTVDRLFSAIAAARLLELWEEIQDNPLEHEELLAEAFEVAQMPAWNSQRKMALEMMVDRSRIEDSALRRMVQTFITPYWDDLNSEEDDDPDLFSEQRQEAPELFPADRGGGGAIGESDLEAEIVEVEHRLEDLLEAIDELLVEPPGPARSERARELGAELRALADRVDDLDLKIAGLPEHGARYASRLERVEDVLDELFERAWTQGGPAAPNDFEAYVLESLPLPLSKAQTLLGAEDALILYLVDADDAFVLAVRPDGAFLRRLDIDGETLHGAVAELRRRLDPAGVDRLGDVPPFDLALAHELYRRTFAPLEPFLDGVQHIQLVAHGPLQSLPLGVLVSEKPQERGIDLAAYREAAWLARKYAMTVLPSVSSLWAREVGRPSSASQPFVGFGDPALVGSRAGRQLTAQALFARGPLADATAIRELPPLPETAVELYLLASSLGAEPSRVVFLRDQATESRVRTMDLTDYRVVAFATHGLMAGQLQGFREAGLVLTPPDQPSADDDGFLSASEILNLNLDADWVILSACNTAVGDDRIGGSFGPDLATAFFYAGARSLLVSHWEVPSRAAVALTTATLRHAAERPAAERAEALRSAMLEVMADAANPHHAHPTFWAPFGLMGQGQPYAAHAG